MKFWEKKQSASPFTKYIEWAAWEEKWYFEYYNGEERVEFKFKKALILEVCYMIKWYDAEKGCQIYSNKIPYFWAELTVISKDRWVIWKWTWKEIKDKIVAIWWKANIVLHALIDWEIVQISLKWAWFATMAEFLKKFNINKNKLVYKWAKDNKKGIIKYRTPVLETWDNVSDADTVAWMNAVKELDEYEERRKQKPDIEEFEEEVEEEVEETKTEDLPF